MPSKTKIIKKYAKVDGLKVENSSRIPINEKSWSAHLYRLFREPKREPTPQLFLVVKYLSLLTASIIIIAAFWAIVRYIMKRSGYLAPNQEISNIYNPFQDEEYNRAAGIPNPPLPPAAPVQQQNP